MLSSDDEGSADDGTLPTWSEWLSGDLMGQSNDPAVIHVDAERVSEWPSDPQTPIAVTEYMTRSGIDEAGTTTSALELSTGEGYEQSHVVLFGSFDPDAVEDHVTGEYDDFQVLGESGAVRSDTFVVSDQYERLIDARNGEAERVTDGDDVWIEPLRKLGDATVSHCVVPESDPEVEWAGQAVDVQGGRVLQDAYYKYSDQERAEAVYQEAVDRYESDPNVDISRDGNVIHSAYDVAHDEVLRTESVLVVRDSVLIEYYPPDY